MTNIHNDPDLVIELPPTKEHQGFHEYRGGKRFNPDCPACLPTDGQMQWLWEQCGWRIVEDIGLWYSVDPITNKRYMGTENKDCFPLMYPSIDLNNLFKYAVPKLRGHDIYLSLHHEEPDTFMCAIHLINDDNYRPIAIRDKDPALALFWAIFSALGGKDEKD